jgi:hypothetical protein
MVTHKIVALLQIESDDPHLSLESLVLSVQSADTALATRQRILDHLADPTTRLIAVIEPDHARRMLMMHALAGVSLGIQNQPRPPDDYVPPADRRS